MTVEIVLLAMVALFVGLRLYAVLGQRSGHEQQPVARTEPLAKSDAGTAQNDPTAAAEVAAPQLDKGASAAMRSLVSADSSFDVARFLEGAQGAYRMILEAFWRGDRQVLADLVGGDVRAAFESAIDERQAAGQTLDNRLIAIERAAIETARVENKVASIEVRFEGIIASVTRDNAGEVIAGSLTDAITAHDVWTFRRALNSGNPNWLLVETDQADA